MLKVKSYKWNRLRESTLWIGCMIAMTASTLMAQKTTSATECATPVQSDGKRFLGLFPEWVKTVAIVSPASPAETAHVDLGIRLLENAGIRVKVMPHARERENGGYISIEAEKRIADLEQAWMDPEVDLILCTRGGVGSETLLDKIDWEKLRKRDMPLVGFSNITALQCAMIVKKAGHPYSGPSLTALLGCDQESLKRFCMTLDGDKLPPLPLVVLRPGKCSGIAVGGHLMLLAKVSGTSFCPDTEGKVIFIECPGQKVSVLREKLRKLHDAGFFSKCAGIVFGHFVNCGFPDDVMAVLKEFAKTVSCPVFSGYPYGHADSNYMIDFRRSVSIDEKGMMTP